MRRAALNYSLGGETCPECWSTTTWRETETCAEACKFAAVVVCVGAFSTLNIYCHDQRVPIHSENLLFIPVRCLCYCTEFGLHIMCSSPHDEGAV